MRVQIHVLVDDRRDAEHGLQVAAVFAVVQGVHEPFEVINLADHAADLGGVDDLLLERDAVERDDRGDDGVEYQRCVVEELRTRKCCDRLQEELGRCLELSGGEGVNSLVNLEPVLPLPVAALLEELLRPLDELLHSSPVALCHARPEQHEQHVHLLAHARRLVLSQLEDRFGAILLANVAKEHRLCEESVSDLQRSLC